MMQYRYEARGFYFEKENGIDIKVDFVCFTPPCPNSYEAELYVMDKLKEYQAFVWSVTRVIE